MSRGRLVFALAVVVTGCVLSTPAAQAQLRLRDCQEIRCGHLAVPLDRSGGAPGELSLYVERRRAVRRPRRGVTLLLAGGPGQPATLAYNGVISSDSYSEFARLTPRNDVVAFDPRGTGRSGLLRCPELERASLIDAGHEAARCAERLGPRRAFYRTSDTVDDIEALRAALGAERLTLLGVSYGTLVAQAYAARYPSRVDRVLLDSVLDVSGWDPFYRDIFRAVPRVLRAVCRSGCRRFTRDPVDDLARLVRRLARRPLRGRVTLASGRRRPAALTRQDLFFTLIAGDLDDLSRATFPGAVKAALRGDPAPILRLKRRAVRSEGSGGPREFSSAAYAATTCEEIPFPWMRFSPPATRFAEIRAAAAGIPAAELHPFDASTAAGNDFIRMCRRWPEASPAPYGVGPGPGALPDVPVLMLSGELDLRTPVEAARGALADWPHARLVVAPNLGHSVLSSFSSCAATAAKRFLRGGPAPKRCGPEPALFPAFPPPPRSLRELRPAVGISGVRGRAVRAVEQTLLDVAEELFASLLVAERVARGGGLRGGRWAMPLAGRSRLRLHAVELVPGVRVSGTIWRFLARGQFGRLRVTGPATPDGVLELDREGMRGRLGGREVRTRSVLGRASAASARRAVVTSELLRRARERGRRPRLR